MIQERANQLGLNFRSRHIAERRDVRVVKFRSDGTNDDNLVAENNSAFERRSVPEPVYEHLLNRQHRISSRGSLKVNVAGFTRRRHVNAITEFLHSTKADMLQVVRKIFQEVCLKGQIV